MTSPWSNLQPEQPGADVTLVPGGAASQPPDQSPSPWATLTAESQPPFTNEPSHETWGQSIGKFGQNMATGVLKGVGQLGGLPHTVAQLGDLGMDLFASPRNNLADLAAGQPPASSSDSAPTPMMAPGPGWLTRHTRSPEEVTMGGTYANGEGRFPGIFPAVSALNQVTGGQPVAPYEPSTTAGKIFQSGMEQVIPSLLGPPQSAGSRLIGGVTGGEAQKAYEIARPDDTTGQLVTGLLAAPLTSLAATGVGRAAGGLARIAQGRWGSDVNQGLYRTGAALDADARAGGPNALDIAVDMRAAPNTPLTPLDVGGENLTTGLGGQVARTPGPARQLVKTTLDTRDEQAGARLNDLADTLIPGGSTYRTQQQLDDAAKTAATPAYTAFENAAPVNPDHLQPGGALDTLLQRPAIKSALKASLTSAANEGIDPNSLGITLNAAGDPIFKGVPSWRTLDFIKTNLDAELDPFRDAFGRLSNLNRPGRATLKAVNDFTGYIDANNDLYAPARAAWGGPQASKTAMDMGTGAFQAGRGAPTAEQITDDLAKLSPSDRQLYQLAAKNELQRQLGELSGGADESKVFIGNQNRQAKIRAIFGSDADTFLNAGQAEKTAVGTRFDLTRGSQTAGRFAQDVTSPGSSLSEKISPFLIGGGSLLAGEPALGVSQLGRGLLNLWGGNELSPGVAHEIARNLLTTDPAAAHDYLTRAYRTFNPGRGASIGSALPTVPMVSGLLNP
jgi:hypothetical protein